MICGRPPFFAIDKFEIMKKICVGKYDFSSKVWGNISDKVKELIRQMLRYDDKQRQTAH